mgnify:FL=1
MKKHYLEYLTDVMQHQWDDAALTNYGEQAGYTFKSLAEQMLRLHELFRILGIKKGDKIALAARNSANWAAAYLAIASYEAVVVSILQDFKAEDIDNLVKHSDAKALFVGPFVWRELQNQPLSSIETIISLTDFSLIRQKQDGEKEQMSSDAIYALIDKALMQKFPKGLQPDDIFFTADPNALALINYTSGSMGLPKGVMLNGRSLSNNVETGMSVLPVEPGQSVVSMLPLAHMFGQICEFLYPLCSGTHIYFLTKTPTPSVLLKALQDVQPYMVVTVPLVIEKIYSKNLNPLLSKTVVRMFWKMPGVGNIFKSFVKKKLKKAFGGNIRYFLCGGAAINPEVENALMDIHFPLSVGYGMTECGPLIGGNPPKYFVAQSGGVPVLNTEVKIDQPNEEGIGEILVKGENVMMGYYKNEEATKAAFNKEGWMKTGDLGYLDSRKNIFIKGRNKTMILGASGQNIYPEDIENKLNNMDAVGESIVVEREGKLIALIFPDEQAKKRFSLEELQNVMRENLQKLNKRIPGYSQVSNIEIKDEPFEKTPKKSIKRFLYK